MGIRAGCSCPISGGGKSMADRVGQQLGNYRLTRLLGQGGFAEVYLGEHIYLKSRAALKVLHTQLSEQDEASFVQEAQTLACLSHPHIVRVLDFAVQDGTPFLVLEYAPHGTLRHRHAQGTRLPLETIVHYVQQVAAALQYAHDQRLIHRDIKPENLLLGERFDLLLSDFGLGLFSRHTLSQSIQPAAGTAFYMAPEQIKGKPRPASDSPPSRALLSPCCMPLREPHLPLPRFCPPRHPGPNPPALSRRFRRPECR